RVSMSRKYGLTRKATWLNAATITRPGRPTRMMTPRNTMWMPQATAFMALGCMAPTAARSAATRATMLRRGGGGTAEAVDAGAAARPVARFVPHATHSTAVGLTAAP